MGCYVAIRARCHHSPRLRAGQPTARNAAATRHRGNLHQDGRDEHQICHCPSYIRASQASWVIGAGRRRRPFCVSGGPALKPASVASQELFRTGQFRLPACAPEACCPAQLNGTPGPRAREASRRRNSGSWGAVPTVAVEHLTDYVTMPSYLCTGNVPNTASGNTVPEGI